MQAMAEGTGSHTKMGTWAVDEREAELCELIADQDERWDEALVGKEQWINMPAQPPGLMRSGVPHTGVVVTHFRCQVVECNVSTFFLTTFWLVISVAVVTMLAVPCIANIIAVFTAIDTFLQPIYFIANFDCCNVFYWHLPLYRAGTNGLSHTSVQASWSCLWPW